MSIRLLTATTLVISSVVLTGPTPATKPHQPDPWPALTTRAKNVVDRLASGDVEPVLSLFTDKMKAALDAARLRSVFPSVVVQAGAFKSQTGTRTDARDGFRVVIVTCAFERAAVDLHVVFDQADRIAGLSARPPVSTVAYSAAPYVTPSAFREEAITIDASGWPLPGTLTMPLGDGAFPGVVLVHGSGPSDRDASFGPNKPFRDLAEGLSSRGIAVLRYDKRTKTHAGRMAALRDLTVKEEVIDDVVAAVKGMRETRGVRADRVFVLGHSLGGMLAPRIAAGDPTVAGLIVMAGAVRSLEQSIVDQTRYLVMLDGRISPEEQTHLDAMTKMAADVRALKPSDPPIVAPPFSAPASYFLDIRGYDPPDTASQLKIPMLVVQGERDYQVTMDDLAAWRRAVGARANVQITSYPTLNHLFMPGSGPSAPAEYSVPGHVDEAVVRDIAAWIARQ